MNILPLVLSFILLLSMMTLTFFRTANHTDYLAHKETSYMKVKRSLQNTLEKEAFRPYQPKRDKNTNPSPKPRTHYSSSRLKDPPSENGKLNISSLFTSQKEPNLPLEKTLIKLILTLYQDKNFFTKEHYSQEEIAKALVKSIIEKGKKTKNLEALTDLYPEEPFFQELLYKMLKSTPPFGDYITLSGEERKPICFKNASIPVLKALFNEKILSSILQKEEENYFAHKKGSSILAVEELKEILGHSSLAGQMETILSLIQFDSPKNSKETFCQSDPKADITISYTIKTK